MLLPGVVHENWEKLVEGHRVECKKAVCKKVDVGLAGEDLERG